MDKDAVERDRQAKEQAKFDKAFEDVKSGKIQPPRNDDSGPLPKSKPNENMAKPIELKAGKPSSEKPYELKPKLKKKGGKVKCMAKGGLASKRADGCAIKGKTRGKIV